MKMNMNPEHYTYMESKLDDHLSKADTTLNKLRQAMGWPDGKLGWHLLTVAISGLWHGEHSCFPVYDYLSNADIDTALDKYFADRS